MQIINGTIDFQLKSKTAIAIGKFDGVHKGHGLILDTLLSYKEQGYSTCVLTFDFPPQAFLIDAPNKVLSTLEEKRLILKEKGIDTLVEYPFHEKTASIPAEIFITDILVDQMNAGVVVVGEDCSFGHGGKGNADMLKKYGEKFGFKTVVIEKLKDDKGRVISSTLLRDLVIEGNVREYLSLATWPYFVYGSFKKSGGIGQKFGLPFCILDVEGEKLLPDDGLYYTKVLHEEVYYPAMSFVSTTHGRIETYMFDGSRDIAKEHVAIGFFEFVRKAFEGDETAYISQEKRIEQFKKEIVDARIWHREHPL